MIGESCDTSSIQAASDELYMAQALDLALLGRGWVNPNPMVGCVLVKNKCVIGCGYHTSFGCLHAEREALADCIRRNNDPSGATAYVTLEPCSHYGKTPPCADALVDAGISRVVIGSSDPNPQVAGQGIKRLKKAQIDVCEGVLKDRCDALNRPFFKYIKTGRPYVVAKYAMTLDGKTATRSGKSKWISGEDSRRHAHLFRGTYAAIMVGIGTVIADDPMLNCRVQVEDMSCSGLAKDISWTPHQPTRIVCDSSLRTPLDSKVVATAHEQPTFIATCVADIDLHKPYTDAGCGMIYIEPDLCGRICLDALLRALGDMGLDSVYVEGGSTVFGALFEADLVDEIHSYIAPKIFGGVDAPGPVGGIGVDSPEYAVLFRVDETFQLCDDVFMRSLRCKSSDL